MCNCKHLIIKKDEYGKTLYKCDIDIKNTNYYFLIMQEKFKEIHKSDNKNFVRNGDCAFMLNGDKLSVCPCFEE